MELKNQHEKFEDKFFKTDAYILDLIEQLYSVDSIKEKFLAVNVALYSLSDIEKQIAATTNDILAKLKEKRVHYEEIREELKNLMILSV